MTKQRTSASRKSARARQAAADTAPEAVDAAVPETVDVAGVEPGLEPTDVAAATPAAPAVMRIDLGSSCTLTDVAALRATCIAALESKDAPVLDGLQVERVDAAGIQVLVGFTIDCMERSINFSWVGRSPQLAHAIHLLGVDALLESPGAATPMGGMA